MSFCLFTSECLSGAVVIRVYTSLLRHILWCCSDVVCDSLHNYWGSCFGFWHPLETWFPPHLTHFGVILQNGALWPKFWHL
jgi:hypothetical protein